MPSLSTHTSPCIENAIQRVTAFAQWAYGSVTVEAPDPTAEYFRTNQVGNSVKIATEEGRGLAVQRERQTREKTRMLNVIKIIDGTAGAAVACMALSTNKVLVGIGALGLLGCLKAGQIAGRHIKTLSSGIKDLTASIHRAEDGPEEKKQ